jgi:hypothetical protein
VEAHTILQHLPIQSARHVSLCLQIAHCYRDVSVIFDSFQLSAFIEVNEHTAVDLLRYLREDPFLGSSHDRSSYSPVIQRLPFLKCIALRDVELTSTRPPKSSRLVEITALVQVLSQRATIGSPIARIVFHEPIGLERNMVETLKATGVVCEVQERPGDFDM